MTNEEEQETMTRTEYIQKNVHKYKQLSTNIQQKVAAIRDPPPKGCSGTKSQMRDEESDDVENCAHACDSKNT